MTQALGVTETEIDSSRKKVASKQWSLSEVAEALDNILDKNSEAPLRLKDCFPPSAESSTYSQNLKGCPEGDDKDANQVLLYLSRGSRPAFTQRPCWEGPPGHSAMPPRLRKQEAWRKEPHPTLKYPCRMCEAEFPNRATLVKHINLLHGQCRFYSTWLYGNYSLSPYIVSPTEKRLCLEHFATAQQTSTINLENELDAELPDQAVQQKNLFTYLYSE